MGPNWVQWSFGKVLSSRLAGNVLAVATSAMVLGVAPTGLTQPPAGEGPGSAEQAAVAEPQATDVQAAYQQSFGTWKKLIADARVAMQALDEKKGQGASATDIDAARQGVEQALAAAEKHLPQLRAAATAAYAARPEQDRELSRLLLGILADDIQRDNFEEAYAIAQTLMQGKCDDKKLLDLAGTAAFATHHFEQANEYWKLAAQHGVLDKLHEALLAATPGYIPLWQEEQAIREKEAQADDLPRVKLTTNRGEIVLELFENEAPETVGNFVSLVEKGYYDGLAFHRVLPQFMAQGGCPKGDGTGGPGYSIYCECYKPEFRKHFRGSLSMAKSQRRDSGGSQFFLTFLPVDHLNGLHTVFGRVVEGMPVLAKLQRRDPSSKDPQPEPDKIVKAEVLRKRNHPYVPTKTQ